VRVVQISLMLDLFSDHPRDSELASKTARRPAGCGGPVTPI